MKKAKHVAFATQKGGAGKTTLTVLLASQLHYVYGYEVAIIDCDYPQHSVIKLRNRDVDMIQMDPFYKAMAYKQFDKLNKKGYSVVEASFEDALEKAKELSEQMPELDFIFFDLPGTVNAKGVTTVIMNMDYIITPITADRVVLESSISFAALVNEKLITTGLSKIKGINMVWNMVDKREKTELYDVYETVINELGISIFESTVSDSKKFRRDVTESHKPIFRSTLFPIDKRLVKSSGIVGLVDEFLRVMNDE